MSRPRARPLFLHTSALSDAEYAVYVDALHDVLDEPEPEPQSDVGVRGRPFGGGEGGKGGGGGGKGKLTDEELEARLVGMREARAWMRGRYRDVGVSEIDKVRLSPSTYILTYADERADTLTNRSYTCSRRTSRRSASPAGSSSLRCGCSCMRAPGSTSMKGLSLSKVGSHLRRSSVVPSICLSIYHASPTSNL